MCAYNYILHNEQFNLFLNSVYHMVNRYFYIAIRWLKDCFNIKYVGEKKFKAHY